MLAAGAALLSATVASAQIPAFPGAEGYGGYAKGGRGGDVYIVTNLNPSGAGSFPNGIATVPAGGRTIIFAVSGYIPLSGSDLRLTASNVTIAGQTAPGDGIGMRNSAFRVSGDEVVVRFMRFRRGASGAGGDCLNLDSGSINSIFDHISMQFSTDENMSSFSSPPENLTLQWSLNAWGLEPHAMGGLWDQNHATCHHSLWAHNHSRDPKSRPWGLLEWINNVTFDYGIGFIMGDSQTPATWRANVLNSYFICPLGNIRSYALSRASLDRNGNPNYTLFLDNCLWDRNGNAILDGTNPGYGMATGSYAISPTLFASPGSIPVTMDDPTVAYKKIVSQAGAVRLAVSSTGPLRDEVDTRLISNLVTQTRNHISAETELAGISANGFGALNAAPAPIDTDKDGMPDYYETALGWNPTVQDHNTPLANSGGFITGTTFFPASTPAGAGVLDKYTRLEEYLHFLAIPHGSVPRNVTGSPTSLVVDMTRLTSGFGPSPSFSVSNVIGGSVALSGVGNSVANFTPTLNYSGRARFDFTVVDAAGHSWTQTCAILVSATALPRDLTWKGTGSVWDETAANWVRQPAGTTVAFAPGDRVAFDVGGSTQPTVTVTGTNAPGSVEVNASANYAFTGTGAIVSAGELTKRGTGTLTISNTGPNGFAAATLESGTLAIGNSTALGNAPLRIEGGTFNIGTSGPTANALTIAGPTNIIGGSGGGTAGIGAIDGSAPLTIQQTNVFDLRGNMTTYGGTVTFTGNSLVRFNDSLGSATATFDLGSGTTTLAKRSGAATITLGALLGGPATTLQGATGGGNLSPTTYVVGGTGASTTFAGTITNGGGTTSISKVGAGTLTVTGVSTHTGTNAVNVGQLAVEGTLTVSPVNVAAGARISGAGTIVGNLAVASGGIVEPGASSGSAAGNLTAGALSLTTPTLRFDLAGTPTGVSDHLQANTASLSGAQNFVFRLSGDTLGAGTYPLINSTGAMTASGVTLLCNLVNTPRQTFALQRTASGMAPGRVELIVTGDPATLTWTGATSSTWDEVTANWTGATPNNFLARDAVLFNDTSPARILTLTGNLEPRSISVNTALGYVFDGPGSLVGTASLTKSGTGTLSIGATCTFSGGTVLKAGSLALSTEAALTSGLGSGPVTFNGGTLTMFNDANSFSSTTLQLVVPAGQTGRIDADSRVDIFGTLTGGGVIDFYVPWIRTSIHGDWSGFTGTINVLSDADGGDFRISENYTPGGHPQTTINLTANTALYVTGILNGGAGTTVEIGALNGPSTARLFGGPTTGRALTYRIGTKGTDATFSGDFSEQISSTTTSLVKAGSGTWTLAGACTHRGSTTVEAGTLRLAATGSISNTAPVTVASGATLSLQGGSISADSLNVESGATFAITGGSLVGELNNQGTMAVTGGNFTVTGDIVNSGTLRVTNLGALNANGAFANEGVLDLLTAASWLPPNFTGTGVVILNTDRQIRTAAKSGATFTCTAQGYTGHTYQLQRADALNGPWTNVGAVQNGAGSVLTFTDAGGATGSSRFYRIQVDP